MIAQLNIGRTEQGLMNRQKRQSAYRKRQHDHAISAGRVRIKKSSIRNDTKTVGIRSLAIAIIDQAITDYFILVRAGSIKDGKPGIWKTRHKNKRENNGLTPEDVGGLVLFFERDCQMILDHAHSDYNAEALFRHIRELEHSQRHLEILRQGTRPAAHCIEDARAYDAEVSHE